MINRQNWLDTRLYLRYLANVKQLSPETVVGCLLRDLAKMIKRVFPKPLTPLYNGSTMMS